MYLKERNINLKFDYRPSETLGGYMSWNVSGRTQIHDKGIVISEMSRLATLSSKVSTYS